MGLLGLSKVESFVAAVTPVWKSKTWVSISILQIVQLVPGWVGPEGNRSSSVIFVQWLFYTYSYS